MHLCAELTVASWILEPFGDICANFSLQLSSRPQFAKITNKKVIAENQCEKHKKSSFFSFYLGSFFCSINEFCFKKVAFLKAEIIIGLTKIKQNAAKTYSRSHTKQLRNPTKQA